MRLAFAVNTIPDRSLSFQVVFTGCTEDDNVHGGAMWARMPIQALVADIPVDNGQNQWKTICVNLGIVNLEIIVSLLWIESVLPLGFVK